MKERLGLAAVVLLRIVISISNPAAAWENHPLLTEPILSTMTEVTGAEPVAAISLETFLAAVEADLVALLSDEETWARNNVPSYKPRPDALAFQATGVTADIRDRFFKAIRINPGTKMPLYVGSLADDKSGAKALLDPSEVSILADTSSLAVFDFEAVSEGELVNPIDVASTASNEPDYGMDIGLFEDNGTAFGQYCGFGVQPFGNPGLDFGSQAPFHMGFYHESFIIYLFASFLKESYPEYRLHLCKSLSEFAFEHGQDYWGWRFMGWGLHYLGDLSMPYHTTALPGYSTLHMLIINLLDLLGWSTLKDNAIQLSSNRHVALEAFQGVLLENAIRANDLQNPILATLLQPRNIPEYSDSVPRDEISRVSHSLSWEMDWTIERNMPREYVSDPSVELGDVPERYSLVDMVEAEHGAKGVKKIADLCAETLSEYAIYGRSFVNEVLGASK